MRDRIQLNTNDDQIELDVDMMISQYRRASDSGQMELCQQLRQGWKEWQGKDSLHEKAFGEPQSLGDPTNTSTPGSGVRS